MPLYREELISSVPRVVVVAAFFVLSLVFGRQIYELNEALSAILGLARVVAFTFVAWSCVATLPYVLTRRGWRPSKHNPRVLVEDVPVMRSMVMREFVAKEDLR